MSTGYQQLVAAVTVGIAQRPLEIRELAGPAGRHSAAVAADPAAAVLDAAALLDAARRAGGLALTPAELPDPAPEDPAPELSRAASDILRDVLAGTDRELLADLVAATARAGARVAAPDLPGLLTVAAPHRGLREPAAAALGARGRWLARQHPDWRRVADAGAPTVRPDAWETGHPAERVAWLRERREQDPAAARELLADGWARETGDDRAALLGTLATGLGAADEPFLEAALDDRKAEVREHARALLARLPGSAFVARARARAEDVLGVERRRLVVHPPDRPDAAARRDGITAQSPYRGVGDTAWQLFEVISRAPLALWCPRLEADPATLVGLPAGEFRDELLAGWAAAAVREGDASWAAALLGARAAGPLGPPDHRLAALLPASTRVARAVAVLAGETPGTLADVAACPGPWPAELTDAVLGYLGAQCRVAAPTPPGELPSVAALRIDVADRRDLPGWLLELADRFRVRTTTVPAAGRWPAALERAAAVLDLRRRFARELP